MSSLSLISLPPSQHQRRLSQSSWWYALGLHKYHSHFSCVVQFQFSQSAADISEHEHDTIILSVSRTSFDSNKSINFVFFSRSRLCLFHIWFSFNLVSYEFPSFCELIARKPPSLSIYIVIVLNIFFCVSVLTIIGIHNSGRLMALEWIQDKKQFSKEINKFAGFNELI